MIQPKFKFGDRVTVVGSKESFIIDSITLKESPLDGLKTFFYSGFSVCRDGFSRDQGVSQCSLIICKEQQKKKLYAYRQIIHLNSYQEKLNGFENAYTVVFSPVEIKGLERYQEYDIEYPENK
jgi:hypothetical protein